MSDVTNKTPDPENPGAGSDVGPVERPSSTSSPEDPTDSSLQSLSLESDQQSAFDEAGVSSDLLALRDAVEATLLNASGEFEALADAPSTEGIVGVGIGLSDPDSLAAGTGVPGEPTLTLFTQNVLPHERLMSRLADTAGTRALSTVPVQQVPVGTVDAYAVIDPGFVGVGQHVIVC